MAIIHLGTVGNKWVQKKREIKRPTYQIIIEATLYFTLIAGFSLGLKDTFGSQQHENSL